MSSWQAAHARTSDPETSHAAAAPTSTTSTILARLEAAYRARGPMTAHEAATAVDVGDGAGAWKRVSDLIRAGILEPTGETRPGPTGRAQRVLRIVPPPPPPPPAPTSQDWYTLW